LLREANANISYQLTILNNTIPGSSINDKYNNGLEKQLHTEIVLSVEASNKMDTNSDNNIEHNKMPNPINELKQSL